MLQARGSEFITISNDNFCYHINPDNWNFGLCVDGDYNSATIDFRTPNPINFRTDDFFIFESSQFIVEKSTISQFDVSMEMGFGGQSPIYDVKLQVHFHSPIIKDTKDIDNYKKMVNRKRVINKILDNK